MEAAALPVAGELVLNGQRSGDSGASARKTKTRSGRHQQKLQGAAFAALAAVSSYLDSDEDLPSFFGRLSATIAQQVGARRAAFWRLGPRGTVTLQPEPFGFATPANLQDIRIQLGLNGVFIAIAASMIVFGCMISGALLIAPWQATPVITRTAE